MKTLLLLGLVGASCVTPKAGGHCYTGDAYCTSPNQALICTGSTYYPLGCHGPEGCQQATSDRAVTCDQTAGAVDGEDCLPLYDKQVQCAAADSSSYLTCSDGKWVKHGCDHGLCQKSNGLVLCQ